MPKSPELRVVPSNPDRTDAFEQRFSPPEFHGLTQLDTQDGVVYAAAIGGLLRAQDAAEILTYPLDQEPRIQDVSRGLRMLMYPRGIVGRLVRRSRDKQLRAVDRVAMRDDLRGVRSVLHQAPDVIEADLQLFGSGGKVLVARDYLSRLPSTDVIKRVQNLSEDDPNLTFDEVAAASLKRSIHNFRVSPSHRQAAIDEYLRRIGQDQKDRLMGQTGEELFYDMWRAFGFADEQADTWALRQELPVTIQRFITEGPEEFRAETVPSVRRGKRPKGDYVERTHVRFYPKTNRLERMLQPMVAWSQAENGTKTLVFPRDINHTVTSEAIVQPSYIVGAALLAGLATEGPDYARRLKILLSKENHFPKRGEGVAPWWSAGLLPLFLPLGEQSIVSQIPSEGYFKRQKSRREIDDLLRKLGDSGLFSSGEMP
ncbi:MAG: hypothetical protein WBP26_01085 [Candidatus Saccharimonadales bacterium]